MIQVSAFRSVDGRRATTPLGSFILFHPGIWNAHEITEHRGCAGRPCGARAACAAIEPLRRTARARHPGLRRYDPTLDRHIQLSEDFRWHLLGRNAGVRHRRRRRAGRLLAAWFRSGEAARIVCAHGRGLLDPGLRGGAASDGRADHAHRRPLLQRRARRLARASGRSPHMPRRSGISRRRWSFFSSSSTRPRSPSPCG